MSQDFLIQMACTVCNKVNYRTDKNKKIKNRLELQKFCSNCNAHTPHKEQK